MTNNCPNCGAPIEHYYNYQCPYCKTFLKNTDETINRASNKEFVIDNVYVEPDMHQFGINVIIYGHLQLKFQYFVEVNEIEMCDIKEMTQKRGYSVFIPYKIVNNSRYKNDVTPLIEYIAKRVPPEFRYADNERKIYEALVEERIIR